MKKLYIACLSLVIFCSLLVGVVTADSQAQPTIQLGLPSDIQPTIQLGSSDVQPTIQLGLPSDIQSPAQFGLPSDAHTQPPTTTTTTTTTTTPTTTPATEATLLSALPSNLQAMVNLT